MARFQKGNPGGPGRPPMPGDLRAARVLNKIELERILNELMYEVPFSEIDSILLDHSKPSIYHVAARIILEAVERGDAIRLDFLLNRLVGKVTEAKPVDDPYTLSEPTYPSMTKQEALDLLKAKEEKK